MKKTCELRSQCRFYLKFCGRSSNVWQGMIAIYCQGDTSYLCERRKYFYETGNQSSENLMPTGKLVPISFQTLP